MFKVQMTRFTGLFWKGFLSALFLAVCVPASGQEPAAFNVVTSFYPMYIMARNVAKDVPGVSVRNLTPPLTGCLHDYAVTNDDMKKLSAAQLFVANGAGMESFLDKVIAQYPGLKVVELSRGIKLLEGAGEQTVNPHVWVSISNAIIEVRSLGSVMMECDPEHAQLYARNTDDYVDRLQRLSDRMHAELAPYKGKCIITFHEAFPYFASEFDLKIAAVVEREPGSEPGARELADTVELIRREGIHAIFSEPQYQSAAAQTISRETGAKVYVLDPAVTGPDDPDAYLNIMEHNLQVLKEALAGG